MKDNLDFETEATLKRENSDFSENYSVVYLFLADNELKSVLFRGCSLSGFCSNLIYKHFKYLCSNCDANMCTATLQLPVSAAGYTVCPIEGTAIRIYCLKVWPFVILRFVESENFTAQYFVCTFL